MSTSASAAAAASASPPDSISTGSCHCGAVKYTVTGAQNPGAFLLCHCAKCKKSSGASFNANLFYGREQFALTQGEDKLTKYVESDTESGQILHRHFCSICGCPLFTLAPAAPGLIVVMSGGLDGVGELGITPTAEAWTKRKAGYVGSVEGVAAFEEGAPT